MAEQAKTFFEHQSLARRNSRVMVVLFLLAVAAVVIAVDLVLAAVYLWSMSEPLAPAPAVPRSLYVWGAVVTAGTIFIVSLINVSRLGGGGAVVAEMAGAKRVASNTPDPLERRLLNVVEEMAIASGVRVPQVYVMERERGINAFAAGWDVSGAVVAVTRGALETLNRDELQGIIGHEFSHILNGDMRLNIRMLGVLAGIVFIGSIGEFAMRNAGRSEDGRAAFVIFAMGIALFIIGYIGLFFGRLIKAAVSRQREFLADASSVQFTRNPDGIAGALDQIRGASGGALIAARCAEDMSHMFFGQSIRVRLAGIFDTHPPLEERIRRVHPRFQPSSYRQKRPASSDAGGAPEAAVQGASGFAGGDQKGRRTGDAGTAWGRSAGESARLVGTMDAGKIDYAARLLSSLPQPLREGLREPDGACAALIALMLAPVDAAMEQQLEALRGAGIGALAGRAKEMTAHTRRLGTEFHLPVVDLGLPAVKRAHEAARLELLKALEAVILADRRVSLHEFVVLTLVRDQLEPRPKLAANRKLADLRSDAVTVLTLIVHAGVRIDATGERQVGVLAALRAGAKEMALPEDALAAAAQPARMSLDAAGRALTALKQLAPLQKALLVRGLFAAATADGTIRIVEAELMRLIGAVLDCPLPPLLAELDPATLPP
jgi:Zn-dependent protease with chaperone function